MILDKPAKRAPRPRKRIVSKGRKGKHTSSRRKSRLALIERCRLLWSRYIKRGDAQCVFIGEPLGSSPMHVCLGGLQAMHGFPKKAYPSVRYSVWNGFCGCAAAHSYMTWREPEWQNWLRQQWGNALYEERLRQACQTVKHDYEEIASSLQLALECERRMA